MTMPLGDPDPHKHLNLLSVREPRAHMVFLAVVFLAIGTTLIFQSSRYSNTPSYANLIAIMPQLIWGVIYLVCAALKFTSIVLYRVRALVIVTHTASFVLVGTWLLAFIVRWLTDSGTTVVNVCSWSMMLYMIIRSAIMLDDYASRSHEF